MYLEKLSTGDEEARNILVKSEKEKSLFVNVFIDNINKSFRPFYYNKELRPTSLYPLLRK